MKLQKRILFLQQSPVWSIPAVSLVKPANAGDGDVLLELIKLRQLIGKSPFRGKIGFPLYVAIREIDIREENLPEFLDKELKAILIKSLAREPGDRYASAEEMKRALEDYKKKTPNQFSQKELAQFVMPFFSESPGD